MKRESLRGTEEGAFKGRLSQKNSNGDSTAFSNLVQMDSVAVRTREGGASKIDGFEV